MTDHKDAAQRQLYRVEGRYMDQPKSQFVIDATLASAQVHATLHLAEQQRIANLIALCSSDTAASLGLDHHALSRQLVEAVNRAETAADE